EDEQAYVHRIGRTGRAGKTGVAVTLVDWDELPRWTMIDKALGLESPDPAETYSNSPHLYDELSIPAGAGGDAQLVVEVRRIGVRLGGIRGLEPQRLVDHRPAGQLVPVDEGHRDTGLAGTPGAADPVHVGLLVL